MIDGTQAMLDRDASSDEEEEDAMICVSVNGNTAGTPTHFRFVRALPHLLLFDAAFVTTLGENNNHSFCPCGRLGSAWRRYFGFTEDLAGGCTEEETEHLTKGALLFHLEAKTASGDMYHKLALHYLLFLYKLN